MGIAMRSEEVEERIFYQNKSKTGQKAKGPILKHLRGEPTTMKRV
jgi:hypothetical protein